MNYEYFRKRCHGEKHHVFQRMVLHQEIGAQWCQGANLSTTVKEKPKTYEY